MLDKAVLNTAARNILAVFAPTLEQFNVEYEKRPRCQRLRLQPPYYSMSWSVHAKERVDVRAVGEAIAAAAKAKGMRVKPVKLIGPYKDTPLGASVRFFLTSKFAGHPVKLDFFFSFQLYKLSKVIKRVGYLNVRIDE